MRHFHLDFETRSEVDIKKVGAWNYAAHPSTSILCMDCAVNDGPIKTYTGPKLLAAKPTIGEDTLFLAHNAAFEIAIWYFILHKRHGWPMPPLSKWRCTMAMALACGLPAALENTLLALNGSVQKDMEGYKVMKLLCAPRSWTEDGKPVWWEQGKSQEQINTVFQRLYQYCAIDVEGERKVSKALPMLDPFEQRVWEADMRMNMRGVGVDVAVAEAAVELSSDYVAKANARMDALSGGHVSKVTQVQGMTRWIAMYGVKTDSLDKSHLDALLKDPGLPKVVRSVLELRRAVGKSSVAKYKKMLQRLGPDGRLRGMFQYHGAGTGRWAGRDVQLQNLPRTKIEDLEACVSLLLKRDINAFARRYPEVMETMSALIRNTFCAAPGKVFVTADYSSVEARCLAWEANDQPALFRYAQNMNAYIDMANFLFNRTDVKKGTPEYQLGKSTVLGCGYGMGPARFKATCEKDGVDLGDDDASKLPEIVGKYGEPIRLGLLPFAERLKIGHYIEGGTIVAYFTPAEQLCIKAVKAYRAKYKPVCEMWYAQEKAAMLAVMNPGTSYPCGRVSWAVKSAWLVCTLPSGREMRYYKPSVKTIAQKTTGTPKREIHYWAWDSELKKFTEDKTYGGKLVENITQAIARDITAHALVVSEKAGYKSVMTAHDELVAEVPEGFGSYKELEALMCQLPKWAAGLPIAAEGWQGKRYRK